MTLSIVGNSGPIGNGALSGTSAAVTVPASLSSNDLAIVSGLIFTPGDNDVITLPSGFAIVPGSDLVMTSTVTTGDHWHQALWYKYISGDSGSWTFSWTDSSLYSFSSIVVRGAPTVNPFGTVSLQHTTYSTLPPASETWSGITLDQNNEWVLFFLSNDFGYSYSGITGWTQRVSGTGTAIFDRSFASSGATGNVTSAANNASDQAATLVSIRSVQLPANTVLPAISDTTVANRWKQGDSLSTTDGTWSGSPTSFGYQWNRDGSAISGASVNTYTLASPDVSHVVSSTVTATNAGGSVSATSSSSGSVSASGSIPSNTILPLISGTPQVFQTLNVTQGVWNNAPGSFSYQWRDALASVSGASTSSYVVPFSNLGTNVDCIVTALNASGSATATAASVGPIASSLQIPVVSQILKANVGTWTGSPTSYQYRWMQVDPTSTGSVPGTTGGTAISGQTASVYTVASVDAGHFLAAEVTAVNNSGSSLPFVTVPTGTVVAGPTNLTIPLLIGTPTQGQTFSTDNGTWKGSPTTFNYQWLRDNASVAAATNPTYTTASVDVGHKISLTVKASNLIGSASATSAQSASIASSGTTTFTISLNSSTNVISWSAYAGAVSYQTAVSNAARSGTRTTTYGTVGSALSWSPIALSGQTGYYGVAAILGDGTAVWCDTEVSITWPSTATAIGITPGDWGGNTSFGPSGGLTEAQDIFQGGIKWIRLGIDEWPNDTDLSQFYLSQGLQAIINYAGPYTGSGSSVGVSKLVGTDLGQSWANAALHMYQVRCQPLSQCPVFEVLNEPYGSWFWGPNCLNQNEAEAYGQLVRTTYTTFHTALGANCPKIIANTFANGNKQTNIGSTPSWWTFIINKFPDIASFYDGVVMHPYGGGAGYDRTLSGQGDRNACISANQITGKPVYITEVGWPTGLAIGVSASTGDSQQWTETDQATNIGNFISWAKGTGFVSAVTFYHHYDGARNGNTDGNGPAFYGVIYGSQDTAGTLFHHKPSFAVVGAG